ncbi:MAG: hypothetical protein A2Y12_09260 [Planctomycetes bacterium GWF2_42_9]|nr:MAG: hypothetical protein A2Y12_09260 [Planctomycetes bacterium GWF2_42_9]
MENDKNAFSPLSIISDIQNKKLSSESLSKDERQLCVEVLFTRGVTKDEIAELMNVRVRTIYRDLAEIRKANALDRSPEFVSEHIGQLVKRAELAYSSLLKIANSKAAKTSEKIDAIHKGWLICKELSQTLQSLCYLPCAATEINAQVNHLFAKAPDAAELMGELNSLEISISESGVVDSALTEMICLIKQQLTLSAASAQISEIKTKFEEN